MVSNERLKAIEATQWELSDAVNTLGEETRAALNVIQAELGELKTKMNVLTLTVCRSRSSSNEKAKRAKVSEPKQFEGAQDAKELENFLFDMEQYFQAVHTESENDKVTMTAMYLTKDAKLW